MQDFTPLPSLLGGILIGLAAAAMLLTSGKIAGISGILGGLLAAPRGDAGWRVAFLAGLAAGGLGLAILHPELLASTLARSTPALIAAGLLVGIGTRLGNGCTSGHGVCGIGRLSKRSMAATGVFMLTGAIAVYVVDHVLGGSL